MCLMVVILLHQVGGISTKGMDEPRRCYGRSYLELYGSVIRLKDIAPAQPQLVEQGCMVVWGCTSKLLTESGVSRCFESSSAKRGFFFFFHLITSRELFFVIMKENRTYVPNKQNRCIGKASFPISIPGRVVFSLFFYCVLLLFLPYCHPLMAVYYWTAYMCFLTAHIWAGSVNKTFLCIKRDNEALSTLDLSSAKRLHLFISDFIFFDKKWAKPWHLCLYRVPNAACCNSFSVFFFFPFVVDTHCCL